MKYLKMIWDWLSGKKSVISGIIALVIGFLQAKAEIDSDTAFFALSLTALLLGVGISHKIAKSNAE